MIEDKETDLRESTRTNLQPKPMLLNIWVFDDSRKPLNGVAVSLMLHEVEDKNTGELGRVTFLIPRKYRHDEIVPKLSFADYSRIPGPSPDKIVLSNDTTSTIIMSKNGAVTPSPTPTYTPTPIAAQYVVKNYSSGGRPSGKSDQFSEWYTLCNDPEPAGWTIESSAFVLSGDRQCNAWSECKQTESTPTKVCWQFRMQGHSEQVGGLFNQGNTGIQFSTGNLRIVWKH